MFFGGLRGLLFAASQPLHAQVLARWRASYKIGGTLTPNLSKSFRFRRKDFPARRR